VSEVKIFDKIGALAEKSGLAFAAVPLRNLEERAPYLGRLFKEGQFPQALGWSEKDIPALLDPRAAYPWAKTIVCFAQPYFSSLNEEASAPLSGKIAPFCAFDWYGLLKDKLRKIKAELLTSFPNLKAKAFVEGKLLEKTWAELAGIGWRGKNSLIYREPYGSRVLLGELLISAEIAGSEEKKESLCGDCTLCIQACPTGALVEPFVIRPDLCLDYFSLHYDGVLPIKVREAMGDRLFGCSECQNACPYNENREFSENPPPGPGEFFPLEEALSMEEDRFRRTFSGHSFQRKPLLLLKRNALIVAGNLGDRSLFKLVEPFAFDQFSLLRQHALWSLWRIDPIRASGVFRKARALETVPRVLGEMEALEKRKK
jgi:epoxyqueuosine reductase